MAMASMRARVYFPAPLGPARMREWGRRPAAMAVRRCSMAVVLPRKSLKVAGRVGIWLGGEVVLLSWFFLAGSSFNDTRWSSGFFEANGAHILESRCGSPAHLRTTP